MFKSKLSQCWFKKGTNVNTFSGVIPASASIVGELIVENGDTIKIEGLVAGNVTGRTEDVNKQPSLIISGTVNGSISGFAHVILEGGKINGNVHATTQIVLLNNARIVGDVTYGDLAIETGSTISGNLVPLADTIATKGISE